MTLPGFHLLGKLLVVGLFIERRFEHPQVLMPHDATEVFGCRLEVATVTTYTSGVASRIEGTTYDYDTRGIRVSALHEVDTDADEDWDTRTLTEYLNDPNNFTGYSQVLRETHIDADTEEIQKVVEYTLGHDQISQTTTEYSGGQPGTPTTLFFAADGHGSTRVLMNAAGAVATIAGERQLFHFDAYGNAVGFNPAIAGTMLQYSGEQFDARIAWQYLRDRWYDPATGRFNRLDPFFGNLHDPQSLHKYMYVHGDPILGADPSGMEFSIAGLLSSMSISSGLRGFSASFVGRVVTGAFVGAGISAISAFLDKEATVSSVGRAAAFGAIFGGLFGALGYYSETAALITGVTTLAILSPFIWQNVKHDWENGNRTKVYFDVAVLLISVPFMVSRLAYR